MFGKILQINEGSVVVENKIQGDNNLDLMNTHVVFEEKDQRILGEVVELNPTNIKINFLGEFLADSYVNGVIRKPLLSSQIRLINATELSQIVGQDNAESFLLGRSSIYKQYNVYPKLNDFFANHLAIVGNSGSGKSCGVARIVQNIFANQKSNSYNANIFIFDAYGEYKTAFQNINTYNPKYCYKFISSNPTEDTDNYLKIPVNILDIDDFALLLQAETHSQLSILERTIRLAKIFSVEDEQTTKFKNHLIAKALLAVLFSNQTIARKKNEIFKIIEVCHTNDFNFDTQIPGLGYTRSFSECFEIDSNGNFGESVLITEYILKHINDATEELKVPQNAYYSLQDFASALEFTLISEGFQNNENLYSESIILKVRLNSILSNKIAKYFVADKFYSYEEYLDLLIMQDGKKAQIININLEDIDDIYAKIIVKIMTRFFFENSKKNINRATRPIHLFLEEAHRYIQKDNDTFLLGYNIFDRIAKEGRKYGVILDIITQRPVELSDTVVAQCSNFLIFKMTHPKDIKYIEEMLPNISADIIDKQKILQSGTCVAFGSAFKIPMIIKMDLPNPMPNSSSCDIQSTWSTVTPVEEPPKVIITEQTNPTNNVVNNIPNPNIDLNKLKSDIESLQIESQKISFGDDFTDTPNSSNNNSDNQQDKPSETFSPVNPTTMYEPKNENNKFIFNTNNSDE